MIGCANTLTTWIPIIQKIIFCNDLHEYTNKVRQGTRATKVPFVSECFIVNNEQYGSKVAFLLLIFIPIHAVYWQG